MVFQSLIHSCTRHILLPHLFYCKQRKLSRRENKESTDQFSLPSRGVYASDETHASKEGHCAVYPIVQEWPRDEQSQLDRAGVCVFVCGVSFLKGSGRPQREETFE